MKNISTVLIAGGGTGGHISPGIALYECFKERGIRAFYCAGKRDQRFSSLKSIQSEDLFFYPSTRVTVNPIKVPFFIWSMLRAVIKALFIIKKNNIQAVIGMGGYVSAPALIAGKMAKIPLFLCEQNTVPGAVTQIFEKYSTSIYTMFKESNDYLSFPERVICLGNPIRSGVIQHESKDVAKRSFNLGHTDKVILAIGGSQGAASINELVIGLKKRYSKELNNVGIIWITGDSGFENYKQMIHSEFRGGSVYISPYLDNVGLAYNASDLAISRSGAGVMAELAAVGLPSIQIPYPHAAKNHQEMNADSFVNSGAALKMMGEDVVAEKVGPVVINLLSNERKRSKMSKQALSIARTTAGVEIVSDICNKLESTLV